MNKKQKERLEEIKEELEILRDEEQEKLDNMYEKFSGTERFELMEESTNNLDEAITYLSFIIDA